MANCGSEYSKNLIKALNSLPEEERSRFELFYLCEGSVEKALFSDMPRFQESLHEELAARIGFPRSLIRKFKGLIFGHDNSGLMTAARQLKLDFVYPLHRTPFDPSQVRAAAWIPDFQHKYMPEYFTAKELKFRDRYFTQTARRSTCVVFSSETTQADFRKFYPYASHKSTVLRFHTIADPSWYLQDADAVRKRYSVPEKYFVVCNQFWQHKNHKIIFEALGLLKSEGILPVVACTGNLMDYRRPNFESEIRDNLKKLGIENQVLLLGLIPRSDQIQLIRGAMAVIQPSVFEGWSTVVEDARALGKTIALSNIAVHLEQDPPHSQFFDPHDPRALADLIKEWWGSLPPGPTSDWEEAARRLGMANSLAFARRFLEIANQQFTKLE